MEPKNPDPEFARQSLGEFFAEQGVKKQVRLSTLQEVEKFVEGIDPRQAIITLGEHSGTLLHAKYYQDGWNAALQAILTHIQEMKGEL